MMIREKNNVEHIMYSLAGVTLFFAMIYFMYQSTTGSTRVENYSNYGSVGGGLVATNAPQEFQVADPTDISKSASSAISASSAVVLADMNKSPVQIEKPTQLDPAAVEGNTMEDIKYATKGDGQIRPVLVNNNKVSNDLVKLSMFENQDFMYRLEHPLRGMPHLQDQTNARQKTMFGRMTYPLVWEQGKLGMDVVGENNDTRVTVSFTGGRPPLPVS